MTPLEWLMAGNTGISSKTILHVMEGTSPPSFGVDVPYDPADFGRCHELLEAIPAYRQRLGEVARKYPAWIGLVREWDQLTAMYLEAKASGKRDAPALYDAMQALIDEGRMADGWIQTGRGCWTRGDGSAVQVGENVAVQTDGH